MRPRWKLSIFTGFFFFINFFFYPSAGVSIWKGNIDTGRWITFFYIYIYWKLFSVVLSYVSLGIGKGRRKKTV